jgi:beta-galactosidase
LDAFWRQIADGNPPTGAVVQFPMLRNVADACEDPAVFGVNKTKPHVQLHSFENESSALTYFETLPDESTSVRRRAVRNPKFMLFPSPRLVPEEFRDGTYDDSGWMSVNVPHVWQLDDTVVREATFRDVPVYSNFQYIFEVDPPFVPDQNPTGCYRFRFSCSDEDLDQSQRHYLAFDGADSAVCCWLNGSFVGYSQDSRLPAEFDISGLVRRENILAVQVMKFCDGSYLEDQDMWRLSGLFRDVVLLRKPATCIQDYKVCTPFDGENVAFSAEVDVIGTDDAPCSHRVKATIVEYNGRREIGSCEGRLEPVWLARSAGCTSKGYRATLKLTDLGHRVSLWSAETPVAYVAVIALLEGEMVSEVEAHVFGFRKDWVDKKTGKLMHNDRPIMIRGVNRHEHSPDNRARVVDSAAMQRDAVLIKALNFNAVRCSHYPNHDLWYTICTLYGLYVIDEANVECHGFDPALVNNRINPTNSTDWIASILDRGVRMYERDKNHASIICWSLGNEAGYGPAHLAMAGFLRARDPSRPVQYEGGGSRTAATDIICPMYARTEQIVDLCKDNRDRRPVILCEYAHSMGNSTGNVHKYWETFHDLERCQGGFVWDWADQALPKQIDGVLTWAYGGDFEGDLPNDGQFICNGVVYPDRRLKPASLEMKHVQSPIKTIVIPRKDGLYMLKVINRHDFIELKGGAFRAVLQVYRNGEPVGDPRQLNPGDMGDDDIIAHVDLEEFDVCPKGEQATSEVSIGITWFVEEEYRANFGRVAEQSVWRTNPQAKLPDVWPISSDCHLVKVYSTSRSSNSKPALQAPSQSHRDESTVSLSYGNAVAVIDTKTGDLLSYKVEDFDCIDKPVRVCLYRAPTDNDRGGSGGKSHAARWKAAGLDVLQPEVSSIVSTNGSLAIELVLKPDPLSRTASCVVEEGIGVGEVGGSHWFSSGNDAAGDGDDAADTNRHQDDPSSIADAEVATQDIPVKIRYSLVCGGTLKVSYSVDCAGVQVPSLPRVGVAFAIPQEFETVSFYGRGPHENYPDRKASAQLLRHGPTPVGNLHEKYIFPGECGGRCEVRWISWVSERSGKKIGASLVRRTPDEGTEYCQFSSSFYSLQELDRCRHDSHLERDECIHVHMDAAHMGVGGDDSWSPSVHEEFLVPPDTYEFDLAIAIDGGCPDEAWQALLRT